MGNTAKSSRIVWREEELAQIYAYVAKHYTEHGITPTLAEAQLVLPEHRRRKVDYYKNWEFERRLVDQRGKWQPLADALKAAKENEPPPPAPVVETPSPSPSPSPSPAAAESNASNHLSLVVAEEVTAILVDIVEGVMAHAAVRESLKGLVATALGRQVQAAKDSLEDFEATAASQAPRVLVAGLIPSQIAKIGDEFGDKLNLRFWQASQSPHQLRRLAKRADVVVGMTSFISHHHEAIMKGNAQHYVRHAGGMDKLRDRLTTFIASS